MESPATAPWNVHISGTDLEKLKQGFKPQDMEDRWACVTDKPDERGSIVVHWQRSWTGTDQVVLRLNPLVDGAEIVEITWDRRSGANEVNEAEGKKLAKHLSQQFLGVQWAA
jgi:hypothetical protein